MTYLLYMVKRCIKGHGHKAICVLHRAHLAAAGVMSIFGCSAVYFNFLQKQITLNTLLSGRRFGYS